MTLRACASESAASRVAGELHAARQLLLSPTPENTGRCTIRLEQAIELLQSLSADDFGSDGLIARQAFDGVRLELAGINMLLESAAAFHCELSRLSQPPEDLESYTDRGIPPPESHRTVSVEG